MEYEVVNEKQGIFSCCVDDLTAEQTASFLAQWEEGAAITSLTLFYDSEGQKIVLNKDNPDYNLYLTLTEKYLEANPEEREKLSAKLNPKGLKAALEVLDRAIEERDCTKMLSILGKATISVIKNRLNIKVFDAFMQKEPDPFWNMYQAFVYGVIQGKRIERAKKSL